MKFPDQKESFSNIFIALTTALKREPWYCYKTRGVVLIASLTFRQFEAGIITAITYLYKTTFSILWRGNLQQYAMKTWVPVRLNSKFSPNTYLQIRIPTQHFDTNLLWGIYQGSIVATLTFCTIGRCSKRQICIRTHFGGNFDCLIARVWLRL